MLQFTYAPSHTDRQRSTTTVVLCVVVLHALAIASLWWTPNAMETDLQQSIAMEMVLAPVSNTPPKAQTQAPATPTAAPKFATAKTEPTTPSASPVPRSADVVTPTAAPGQPGKSQGAPAFSLPSSEAQGLNNPKPAYPRMSRRLNEQGQVVIRVFVAADGSPQQGEIKTSSGFDRLDQEALRTVMRWRFVPGQRFGTPEAMWFNVPVLFVLE
jgi:periplasmic protein TonB